MEKRCPHSKRKKYCNVCSPHLFCDHGKAKQRCVDCGGSKVCPHKKYKFLCKECSPHLFCEHGKRKNSCMLCEEARTATVGRSHLPQTGFEEELVSALAADGEEGILKTEMSDFAANAEQRESPIKKLALAEKLSKASGKAKQHVEILCPHGKRERQCKACGGAGICPHGKLKSSCVPCGGSRICEHLVNKAYCKQCKGSQICACGKVRARCEECGKKCPHGNIPDHCKECKCVHNKRKRLCKECDGSGLCEHDKDKYRCIQCKNARRGIAWECIYPGPA